MATNLHGVTQDAAERFLPLVSYENPQTFSYVTFHFKPRHLHKAPVDPRLDSLP